MLSIRLCSALKLIIRIAVLLIFVCIPSISPALAEDPLKNMDISFPIEKKDISENVVNPFFNKRLSGKSQPVKG